jgi:hypothetical protein
MVVPVEDPIRLRRIERAPRFSSKSVLTTISWSAVERELVWQAAPKAPEHPPPIIVWYRLAVLTVRVV